MEKDKSKILQILSKELGSDVELCPVPKLHNVSDNFICKTSNRKFFCRIGSKDRITHHINGENMISKYLPVPKTLSPIYEINSNTCFCLQECCEGNLFTYSVEELTAEEIICLEISKENLLSNLYKNTLKPSKISDYLKSNSQELFIDRILGNKYKDFFSKDTKIGKLCSKQIFLNGKKLPISINDIFKQLFEKIAHLQQNSEESLWTVTGHADLHHGNIIVDRSNIHIIDLEYASEFVTPNMDIAKPYYNDIIGILFFHYQSELKKYVDIEYRETGNEIHIDVNKINIPKIRVDITDIKVKQRKLLFDFSLNNNDLSIVDYLIICHTLTKDPSLYPKEIQIIFIYILYSIYYMDWEKPHSLFNNRFIF
jgi:thiamine kinase-like enzyme